MRGRGAEIGIYHTYCRRGRISPRFRGKYIVLAIRYTSGRKPILVRVNGTSKLADFYQMQLGDFLPGMAVNTSAAFW